jgi:hypothetical protein
MCVNNREVFGNQTEISAILQSQKPEEQRKFVPEFKVW